MGLQHAEVSSPDSLMSKVSSFTSRSKMLLKEIEKMKATVSKKKIRSARDQLAQQPEKISGEAHEPFALNSVPINSTSGDVKLQKPLTKQAAKLTALQKEKFVGVGVSVSRWRCRETVQPIVEHMEDALVAEGNPSLDLGECFRCMDSICSQCPEEETANVEGFLSTITQSLRALLPVQASVASSWTPVSVRKKVATAVGMVRHVMRGSF